VEVLGSAWSRVARRESGWPQQKSLSPLALLVHCEVHALVAALAADCYPVGMGGSLELLAAINSWSLLFIVFMNRSPLAFVNLFLTCVLPFLHA
jgi:hypothetical protein